MSKYGKSNKKSKKNIYTRKLYKINKDDDFFKSSSEDLSNSVSFQQKIKQSDLNNKTTKEKNIIFIKSKFNEKILNSKGSTSSSNKIKNVYEGNKDNSSNNNLDKDVKNFIQFQEIENSENSRDIKEKSIKISINKENDDEKNNENNKETNVKLLDLNVSLHSSKKELLSSNHELMENEKNSNRNEDNDDKSEDMKKIMNNYVDSSFNSSAKKNSKLKSESSKNNSRNIKKDSSSNIIPNKSSKSNLKSIEHEENEESKERDSDTDRNVSNLITLKPVNIHVRNKNHKTKSNKKISAAYTTSDTKVSLKKEENAKIQRNLIKKISQREYSINSSVSSDNDENKEENKIKIFIEKYFLNVPILILMIAMNFCSLYLNDIRHIWLDRKVDIYFDIINLITIIYFIVEINVFFLLDNTYFNSFTFWIDVIGVLCIFFNIELITNYIFGYNLINTKSNRKINNSIEYLLICIIMLERVLRAAKILKCLKLYNLTQTVKKINKIYSEKMQREIMKEEKQKIKIMQKIHNIEEEDIKESVFSNESFRQNKNSFLINNDDKEKSNNKKSIEEEKNDKEDKDNEVKAMEIKLKKLETIKENEENNEYDDKEKAKIAKIKRSTTLRTLWKINKGIFRRESLKSMRQNNNLNRNAFGGSMKLNAYKIEREKEEKNEDENEKRKKQMEEEMYKKIDENINNIKIANKIKYIIRKKIIVIFIILLLICVILNEELFSDLKDKENNLAYSYIFDIINNCPFKDDNSCEEKIKYFLFISNENELPILNITKNNILIYENINLTKINYRYCDLRKISSYNNNENINIIYSLKRNNTIKHILFLILTIILCISFLSSILSETDLSNILLTPLEVMIEVADKVAKDPINAKNIEELQHGVFDILQKNINENTIFKKDINKNYNERYNTYEVKAIMNAIIKISALLAMSVGDAGGEVIHKNLSSNHELHLHSHGKKKLAIFGFCNIRNFEEINLALEEETVPLINKIAEIVHSSVDKFRGNTNKNIGDSFLNVWKFYNNIGGNNNGDKKKDNLLEIDPTNPQVNITADCAVLAYLRCILKINKNLNILEYKKNKKLKKIMPNFKINMGFGLHLGYGIEGPVGSDFKIEASYLSPNVNIAARLETASKQFGVNLLISGKLYNYFTEDMKGVCRYVDCVTVKGSTEPIDLYTIDINSKITPQRKEKLKIVKTAEEKAKVYKEKKTVLEGLIEEYGSITPIILEKRSYWELIDEKSERFYDSWEYAMSSYKEGKWDKAKKYFEECLEEDSADGPTNTLYNYIKKFDFKSPDNWKGERELISK